VSAEILTHDLGLSWVMDDALRRTSHALVDDGRVWLIDPVDEPSAMAAATALGEPVAVLVLLDRHRRDARAVAERLGITRLKVPAAVPDSPFEVIPSGVVIPQWSEVGLWWPERSALVVPEVLGTSPHYTLDSGPVGVHPLLRALPPTEFRHHPAEHLLPGHGAPLHGPQTAGEIEEAYARSRRDLPKLLTKAPRMLRAANQAYR
jgi:hypothetical protein